ncbi:BamA/TamA family outer membrane protein [Sphingomonas sp. QA11]|uniref:autotransporter assembly complex protein TamA n=1 Tax=Sphingomonas sp. QA11 TaxID=2950605 RepID=UPI00234A0B57|nr:BamA/TamA family outer membrane protein [Sphingomonas sp. QA11]WCM29059.1 BamA/TamA family outer membrane protein [Sphingomonas sp. QA11]
MAQPATAQRRPDPLEQARDSQKESAKATDPAGQGADAPIIPDSQFEQALPAIDPALNQPLAPIESIDLMPVTQPATPAGAQPAQQPAAAPAAVDPALAEPLPPLAGFDVEPPAAATGKEASDAPPELRYSVKVEGLEAVGLEHPFRALSSLDKGDGKGANGAVISARAREDEGLALRMLRAEGYYDGVVSSLVEPVQNQPGRVTATISASPGSRYTLGAIVIEGPETVPPGLVRSALALRTGDPIVASAIEAAEGGVALQLPQQGYPFVKVGERDIELDDATHLGAYTLPVDPGPRSSFGTYSTTGKLAFNAAHVGVLARFKPGELYDDRRVNDLREALVATGLFDSVAVEPRRTGQLAPDGTEVVDLLVTQNAGKPRRLAATAGYSTGQGLRLDASWTHRNLFGAEGSLAFSGTAGTQEQGAAATFRRANAGRRDKTVLLSVTANRQNFDAYKALTLGINGRISLDSTPIWQKRWTWAYGFELLGSREDTFQAATGKRAYQNYGIAGINGQVGFDSTNSLLDPTKGFRAMVRISPETSQTEGSNYRYIRAQMDGSTYYPVTDSLVMAGRIRVASIAGAPRDAIAPSRRLYAGGGGSVRGFGYQQLGPRDSNNDPVGGRSLVEGAIEARYRFGNFGIVPFFDVGQAYASTQPKFTDLRYGAGIGARYYTNFGPVRFDVATPLGRRKGESKVAIYISIGQAF